MVVGLTGGIGSGKTTVAHVFQKLGVAVYNSDQRAKDLYSESAELKSQMQAHFGKDIYSGTGINRGKLAQIVFNDKAELAFLNNLIHPLLQKDFLNWNAKQTGMYVIREAAILIESGAYKSCDKVIVVTADEVVRVDRVMSRDKATRAQVTQRIANQITDADRLKYAHFEIKNNATESLIEQVLAIDAKLKNA